MTTKKKLRNNSNKLYERKVLEFVCFRRNRKNSSEQHIGTKLQIIET